MKNQLAEVGIFVEPTPLSTAEFETLVRGESVLDIDMLYYPSPITLFPRCQLYQTSYQYPDSFEASDLLRLSFRFNMTYTTGYSNNHYDQLCQKAQQTVSFDEVLTAYSEVHYILMTDLPTIPLFIRTAFVLTRPEVRGFTSNGLQIETWNVEDWFIDR